MTSNIHERTTERMALMVVLCILLCSCILQGNGIHFIISTSTWNCTDSNVEEEHRILLSELYDSNEDPVELPPNTTITFLSGVHLLKSNIVIRDTEDLTINFFKDSQLQCDIRSSIAFINISSLQIHGLQMTNCGAEISEDLVNEAIYVQTSSILKIKKGVKAAIFAINIRKLHMKYAIINGSHGYGFLGINIIGDSLVSSTLINSSNKESWNDYCMNPRLTPSQAAPCHGGNALFIYNDFPSCPVSRDSYSLTIQNSTFSHGLDLTENFNHYVSQGYGLGIVVSQIYYNVQVKLINSTFSDNIARSFGSNLFIRLIFSETESNVSIHSCQILQGRCSHCNVPRGISYSSLVFFYGLRVPSSRGRYKHCKDIDKLEGNNENSRIERPSRRQILLIENSTFYANHGGTIYIILFSNLNYTQTYVIVIRNCMLSRNKATKSGALYIADITPRPENNKELEVIVVKTTFEGQETLTTPYTDTRSNTNLLLSIKKVTFKDCAFSDNDATAIVAHDTSLHFEGVNVFERNTARVGAAIKLTGVSIIYLRPNTHMIFDSNSALERGGAVYLTRGSEESYFFDCQIQVFDPSFTEISHLNISMVFVNNSAREAGDALYGGRIDACYTAAPSQFLYSRTFFTSATFDTITDLEGQPSSMSLISSDPIKICFCFNGRHNCSVKRQNLSKFPGEEFGISVVGVGQRDGTVPAVVLAYSHTNVFRNSSQQTGRACTDTHYRVESNSSTSTEHLYLVPNTARSNYPRPLRLTVNLLDCNNLTGFAHDIGKRVCICVPELRERNVTCDINTRIITRQAPYWLGNYSNHLLLHDNCPYDYCKTTAVEITMTEPNISKQCAANRYGTLCGSCREGFSQVFGSSRCLKCSNIHLLLIILFALGGIVLVAFLFALNLTVSVGTINGLIFYANIVKINETIFFPPGDRSFFRVFISWVNLDLGIETCFYAGMSSLIKVTLQFAFPLYLWTIVALTILVFRHSTKLVKLVRLCGNHSVSVLATIFLLSCTKLQRTITSALSLTTLEYVDSKKVVWLCDGNIQYATGGHLALFLFSLFFLLVIGFPYALLIFTVQFLRRYSGKWFLRWVNKLMPIFDAYLGPYKPKQGYWTGLLLFVRVLLVAVFAIDVFGNPAIDIFVVSVIVLLLVLFNLGQGGVYNQSFLTVLEISYTVNLGILAAATGLVRQIDGKQRPVVIYTSTAIALVTFLGTLVYHVKLQGIKWRTQWKRYQQRKKQEHLSIGDHQVHLDKADAKVGTSWKLVTSTIVEIDMESDT